MTYPLDEPTTEELAANESRDEHGAFARHASDAFAHDVRTPRAEPVIRAVDARHTSVAPLQLPSVSRVAARVTRSICDTRLAAHLQATLGVTDWHAALTDAPGFYTDCADPGVIELSMVSGDAGRGSADTTLSLRIALDLRTWPALGIAAWPDRDTLTARAPADLALRQAVAGVLLEPLVARLKCAGFDDPRVIDVRRQRIGEVGVNAKPQAPMVALSFALDSRQYRAAMLADTAFYGMVDRLTRNNPTAEPAQSAAELAIPGSLILGAKRLAVETLNALEPGDVLLRAAFPSLDATLFAASDELSASHARPRAVAAWGVSGLTRVCAAVEIDGRSLVIVKEPNMSEELDPASADAGLAIDDPADPIRIDELELPVQFEIDTVALPLAQLSALGPGYVLELPVPVADAQLRLVAHGQTIGYGELVTVGEHLGIRIIRMAHRHGPVQ